MELELELEAAAAAAAASATKSAKDVEQCNTPRASLHEDAFSNRVLVQPLQPWQPLGELLKFLNGSEREAHTTAFLRSIVARFCIRS